MLATEISSVQITAALCGRREVKMVFNHNQMRQSELYWQYSTHGGMLGYMGICDQLAARTYMGLGAIAYGAVAAAAIEEGKQPLSMREFDRMCSYGEMHEAAQAMMDAVLQSLPKGRSNRKNVYRRAQRRTTIRGGKSSADACVPASPAPTSGE